MFENYKKKKKVTLLKKTPDIIHWIFVLKGLCGSCFKLVGSLCEWTLFLS